MIGRLITRRQMTADDAFRQRGLDVFAAALLHLGAMTPREADEVLSGLKSADGGLALARELGQRLLGVLGAGDDGKGWFKYEISEIGYNFDVTSFGYGDAAQAREWELLNEEDNTFVYVTRLGTMEALAAGLLAEDGPGAPFAELITRLKANRARDAELKERIRAAWAARHPRKI